MNRIALFTPALLISAGLFSGHFSGLAAEETVTPKTGAAEPAVMAESESVPEAKQSKPWLGIVPSMNADGVFVDMVQPGTTAEALGLQAQDRIVSLHGQDVKIIEDLSRILQKLSVGSTVQIEYERAGKRIKTTAALQAKPQTENDHAKALEIHGPVGVAVARIERELQAVREALSRAGMNSPKQDLASAMASLSQTLDVLPGRLETAAESFQSGLSGW